MRSPAEGNDGAEGRTAGAAENDTQFEQILFDDDGMPVAVIDLIDLAAESVELAVTLSAVAESPDHVLQVVAGVRAEHPSPLARDLLAGVVAHLASALHHTRQRLLTVDPSADDAEQAMRAAAWLDRYAAGGDSGE